MLARSVLYNTLLVLLAIVALSDAYKYISSIDVDAQSGQIYVGETTSTKPVLYELDCVSITQNAVHYLPGQTVPANSFFIGKRGGKRVLYSVSEGTGETDLEYFKVPIGNQRTLPAKGQGNVGTKGLSLSPTYNVKDNLAILPVSRNLTLVDLSTLGVLDSVNYYIGSRLFGKNLVYNYQNNHLISFKTRVPIGAGYGLSVDEFDLSTKQLVAIDTTYNCLCDGPNPEQSPFYHAVFAEGNCDIDHTVSPARIWCVDPDQSKFFNFDASNLSIFDIFTVGITLDNVAWDFVSRKAYAIDDGDSAGYSVHKIDLDSHLVLKSFTDPTTIIDSTTFKLDPEEPHLYIAVANYNDDQPTQIAYVNTNTLIGHGVVTLNTDL